MQVLFLDIDGVLNRFGDEDGKGSTPKLRTIEFTWKKIAGGN